MKAVVYDHITKNTEVKLETNLKIEDIQICNIPKDYFVGRKPDPSSPFLEMTILLDLYGKKFRKEIVNKDNFKKIP